MFLLRFHPCSSRARPFSTPLSFSSSPLPPRHGQDFFSASTWLAQHRTNTLSSFSCFPFRLLHLAPLLFLPSTRHCLHYHHRNYHHQNYHHHHHPHFSHIRVRSSPIAFLSETAKKNSRLPRHRYNGRDCRFDFDGCCCYCYCCCYICFHRYYFYLFDCHHQYFDRMGLLDFASFSSHFLELLQEKEFLSLVLYLFPFLFLFSSRFHPFRPCLLLSRLL
mmetsp:Transcript_5609/g.10611  ORF Transcript_5609/g.10611 Transcript_5609/m.10611 type:complete len:219 (-) Transcript_5609:642-1298(-)